MRRLVSLLLLAPASALAFDLVDFHDYPSSGRFPAYPAEEGARPVEIYARAGLMRDSNVLRVEHGRTSETIMRYGVGLRSDTRVVGRQGLHFEARADHYDYDRFNALDHNEYRLLGEWRWEFTNDVSGTLGYDRRTFLASLAELRAPIRDIVTVGRFYGTAAYRFLPDWRLRGAADWSKADHSDDLRKPLNARVGSGVAGIDYFTPAGNALGVEYRHSHGDFPVPELFGPLAVENDFREDEVAGVLTYTTGPQLRATGRLGRTHRTHTEFPERNFSGGTGRLNVDWLPANKTILGFTAWKEARTIFDIAANYVLSTGVAFGPRWAPTAKLSLGAAVWRERLRYQGEPTSASGLPLRDDVLRFVRFSAGWEPFRYLEVGAALDYGERDSNFLGGGYRYNALLFNVRGRF